MMSLQAVATATSGQLYGDANLMIEGICTDSRQNCTQRLFIALTGPNFDGHDYLGQAQQAGAVAALLSRDVVANATTDALNDFPYIIVADTLRSMAAVARQWREQFTVPVVAITGSAGKTTLKEMLAAVLVADQNGLVTQGNFNNEIGVPLTLTRLQKRHQFAVIEMGMSDFGEMSRLSTMAQPNIAVINNAAAAHLDCLGSVSGVAKAKGEIIDGLADDGVLVINGDDDFADAWQAQAGERKVVRFGLEKTAQVTAEYKFTSSGTQLLVRYFDQQFALRLPTLGKHNVMNALAVIAVVGELGVSSEELQIGFECYQVPQNRTGRYEFKECVIIDDSYNANPSSMKAAVDLLALERNLNASVEAVLVLGDMGELGDSIHELHVEVGAYAHQRVDSLLAVGQYATAYAQGFAAGAKVFVDQAELLQALQQLIDESSSAKQKMIILVKGSNSSNMDRVVSALLQKNQAVPVLLGEKT